MNSPATPASPRATTLVVAGVIIERGEVLLTRRKRGTHLEGAWEFPGGKLHEGEDPRDALRRELREELGIEVDVGDIVDVTFHRYGAAANAARAPDAVLLLFYEASRLAGSPEPRALDVADFAWTGVEGLDPGRFPPADVAVLEKVRARLAARPR